jgi:hypothetical protein
MSHWDNFMQQYLRSALSTARRRPILVRAAVSCIGKPNHIVVPCASTLTAIKTAIRQKAKEFYRKFSAARYWMTATQAVKHAQSEFETRCKVKEWLIEQGVLLSEGEAGPILC